MKNIAWLMILLMVSLPISGSIALAQLTQNPQPPPAYSPADVGQSCIKKHQKTNSLVMFLENDVIAIIESIIAILYAITTIANAIDAVLDSLFIFNECCLSGNIWSAP